MLGRHRVAQQLKVFVSHSSADKAACDTFVGALRRAGAEVWYDEHNLGAGHLLDEIQREVQTRPIFVVLLSKAAFGSPWVRRETTWAFNLYNREPNRLILPVTVNQIEPSDFNGPWLFLEDFKRVEAPGLTPYALAEATERALRLLELTPAGTPPTPVASPQPTESVDDLLAKGKALTAQGRHTLAIPFFERATQVDPHSVDAWANLARLYEEVGRWQDGLAACDRALALDDKQEWVWGNKGNALERLKRYDEALAACDRALAIDPNFANTWNTKGAAFIGLKLYQEAIAALGRALALNPNDAGAWSNRGIALRNLGRTDEALAAYDRALAIDPSFAAGWSNKGNALNRLKRFNEALAACDRALALNPNRAGALANKGMALTYLKRYHEAVAVFEKQATVGTLDGEDWRNKAISLRALGRTAEAEEAERRAKALGG
jgi:tetratricopeptide (TPR) repeat protein